MRYRSLGSTGMQVSELCLGTMMFGPWGDPDPDACVAIVDRALDAGINFVDTADVYSQGVSEEIVGRALAGRRDEVILATKVHGAMDVPFGGPGGDPNKRGNSRRGSSPRSRTACAVWGPTGSTCTRSTGRTRTPTSRRRSGR